MKISGRQLVWIDSLFAPLYFLSEQFVKKTRTTPHTTPLIIKLFGMGSLVMLARLMNEKRIDKSRLVLLTLQKNLSVAAAFGFENVITVRTSGPLVFIKDCFKVFSLARQKNINSIIDFERCSYSIGTFRNMIAAFLNASTVAFGKTSSQRQGCYRFNARKLSYVQWLRQGIEFLPLSSTYISPVTIKTSGKILVNINASDYLPERRYPLNYFAEVIYQLLKWNDGIQFVLTGSAQEKKYVDKLTQRFPSASVVNMAGAWSQEQLVQEIASCRLLITGDSGPLHIATFYQTPTVVVWGPTQPEHFGYNDTEILKNISLRQSCSPCFLHPHSNPAEHCEGKIDCLRKLHPMQIVEAAIILLSNEQTPERQIHFSVPHSLNKDEVASNLATIR